jgi:hypothetical protein
MDDWAKYCSEPAAGSSDVVVAIGRGAGQRHEIALRDEFVKRFRLEHLGDHKLVDATRR